MPSYVSLILMMEHYIITVQEVSNLIGNEWGLLNVLHIWNQLDVSSETNEHPHKILLFCISSINASVLRPM